MAIRYALYSLARIAAAFANAAHIFSSSWPSVANAQAVGGKLVVRGWWVGQTGAARTSQEQPGAARSTRGAHTSAVSTADGAKRKRRKATPKKKAQSDARGKPP